MLALLFYGYARGVFSSRKIEKATYENLGFRFVASGFYPEHDTIAHFRKTFLKEIQGMFVEILLLEKLAGILKLGNLSLDGSKSYAVSHKRLLKFETQLKTGVARLLTLWEQAAKAYAYLVDGAGAVSLPCWPAPARVTRL